MDYLIDLREDGQDHERLWDVLGVERDPKVSPTPQPTSLYSTPADQDEIRSVAEEAAWEFARRFPRRRDRLEPAEVMTSMSYILQDLGRVRRLLSHYDFVVGYSTDGVFPLLAGAKRYIAYEHGTIRNIPFQRTSQGRLCALTYAAAADVLITNADNIAAAAKLKLTSFRFTPHAILETWRDSDPESDIRRRLEEENGADFVIFHPARHHWSDARDPGCEKGNDLLITAFAQFVREERPNALLVTIDWGESAEASRCLIEELGIADRVLWLSAMPLRPLLDYVRAADVLADQFTIGAWGGILPLGRHDGHA